MSKSVAVAWGETAEELYGRYRAEEAVARRKRLQVLWRVRAGDVPAVAGEAAGVGARTVERWLAWYRQGGVEVVLRRVPGCGGRRSTSWLGPEQERALVAECATGAFRTYEEARAWVAAEYGVRYRYKGMHAALRRLGVHPKVPRPVAEKADPAAQEAWKQGG
jgi:transposase